MSGSSRKTKSRWAQVARAGKKVMQFIQGGRYAAVVAKGESDFVRQTFRVIFIHHLLFFSDGVFSIPLYKVPISLHFPIWSWGPQSANWPEHTLCPF
jgi:hypothetical protein